MPICSQRPEVQVQHLNIQISSSEENRILNYSDKPFCLGGCPDKCLRINLEEYAGDSIQFLLDYFKDRSIFFTGTESNTERQIDYNLLRGSV